MWGVRTWSMHVSMSMQFLPPQSQNAGALPVTETVSTESPEFESESLTIRESFKDLMNQILTVSIEEITPLHTEVSCCQKKLVEQITTFRKDRH